MRLNLGLLSNPKDTLRLWSTELRRRVFSSPEEFVYADYAPTPFVATTGTADPLDVRARYVRHGDVVIVEGVLEMTLTGAGIGVVSFRLPVVPSFSDDVTIYRPVLIFDSGLGRVMAPMLLTGDPDGPIAAIFEPSGGVFAAGTFIVYLSLTYEAA